MTDFEIQRCGRKGQCETEIEQLRTQLAILREQEPVAWAATDEDGKIEALGFNQSRRRFDTPLYAAPMPPSVPDGWQLVPVEPTKAMCKAGERVRRYDKHNNDEFMPDIVYASMLAAAPKPGDE